MYKDYNHFLKHDFPLVLIKWRVVGIICFEELTIGLTLLIT